VRLLAVSKGQPVSAIQKAQKSGIRAFGENHLQDAIAHIDAAPTAEWHFIGRLQSNKTRQIAERFAWVQSVDREQIAARLSAQRPDGIPPLAVCLQVNFDGDPAKGGCPPADLRRLVDAVAGMPRLQLRGLMTVPALGHDEAGLRAVFERARDLFDECRTAGHALDTLSMGMSDDFELAIAHGATHVRVGSAIFGSRDGSV
jgi:pyridoxal phosphate enzyme (YggS family)